MNHRRSIALLLAGTAVTLTAACGDDAGPTTEAYCSQLQALPQEDDPFGEFFRQHPDPTLDDWAAGLPDVVAGMRETRSRFDAVAPSADLADEKAAALAAFDRVVDVLEQSREAAAAGDQDRFDDLEATNQDETGPAVQAAFATLQSACGAPSE